MDRMRVEQGVAATCPRCTLLVGVDVAFADVVAESVDAFGELYLNGTFTPRELRDSLDADGNWDMHRLTTRLAAKESVLGALQLPNAAHREIEILGDVTSVPSVRFSGAMAKRAARLGLISTSITISQIDDCISATCLAVVRYPSGKRMAQHLVTLVESARRCSPSWCRSGAAQRRSTTTARPGTSLSR